jgi:hypothetical protein
LNEALTAFVTGQRPKRKHSSKDGRAREQLMHGEVFKNVWLFHTEAIHKNLLR